MRWRGECENIRTPTADSGVWNCFFFFICFQKQLRIKKKAAHPDSNQREPIEVDRYWLIIQCSIVHFIALLYLHDNRGRFGRAGAGLLTLNPVFDFKIKFKLLN